MGKGLKNAMFIRPLEPREISCSNPVSAVVGSDLISLRKGLHQSQTRPGSDARNCAAVL